MTPEELSVTVSFRQRDALDALVPDRPRLSGGSSVGSAAGVAVEPVPSDPDGDAGGTSQ